MKAVLIGLLTLGAFAQAPKISQHMVLLESTGTDLNVSETILIEGPKAGTLPVYVPPAATLRVSVRGATPPERELKAVATGEPGVYRIPYQLGETEDRIDLEWTMPFVVPEELSGRILHGGAPVRIVVPDGVKASGAMLESSGVEPATRASIYTLKGTSYKIAIDGAGSLRAAQPPPEPADAEGAPELEPLKPRVYDRLYWILGLTVGILVIGFYLNYRASLKS